MFQLSGVCCRGLRCAEPTGAPVEAYLQEFPEPVAEIPEKVLASTVFLAFPLED